MGADGMPAASPAPWQKNMRRRARVARGSSCLSPPAAAFRGFTNSRSPARALLFVQALETLEGQVDLAADLEAFRESVPREPERNGTDGAHVRGDVLAPRAVPARCRHREPPALVPQADRNAVELGLGDVLDLLPFPELEPLAHAPVEVGDSRLVEGIGEGEHGHLVDDLGEPLERGAPDPLRGRIGSDELGVRGLQGQELREQAVILRVRDLRLVLNVVETVVAGDGLAQLGRPPDLVWRRGANCPPSPLSRHSGRRARGGARSGPRARAAPASPAR